MPNPLICPKCSTPLQYPPPGVTTVTCPNCQNVCPVDPFPTTFQTSQIPEQFRPLVEKALQVAQQSGHVGPLDKIQAIRFYRQATGAGLADAKRIIESVGPLHVGPSPIGNRPFPTSTLPPDVNVSRFNFVGCLSILGLTIGLATAIFAIVRPFLNTMMHRPSIYAPGTTITPTPSIPASVQNLINPPSAPQFATVSLEFGAQGVSPGHFDDARSIAVDNLGHIFVGEYSNGRVQSFDSTGKYLSEFSLGPNNYLQNLIADRTGTLYAVSSSHILRFNAATGAPMSEMDNNAANMAPKDYTDACLAPHGIMYALSNPPGDDPEIVKLNTTTGEIINTFNIGKAVGENLDLFRITSLATGEIYTLDREKGVFKFSSDGRYINRFGGGKSPGVSPMDMPPSQLFSAQNIAADSQGRIYVSDTFSCIKVYDKDGNYLTTFGGHEVAFGISIDDQDNIYAAMRNKHTIRKYVIAKN
jgi:LSD1 subclass zinc finger protein